MSATDETFVDERGSGALALQTRVESAIGTVNAESNRQIAEIQGMIIVAQKCPRNPIQARDRILASFTRPKLAKAGLYSYPRGKQDVSGPSIRAAEAMALSWGNMKFGMREIEQRYGESTIYSYAWDLETNVIQDRQFTVSHRVATRGGMKVLEDPREIYENNANQGARRMRACILAVIPSDVTDEVVEQIHKTLSASVKITPELVKSIIDNFESVGVSKQAIEGNIRRHLDITTLTPALVLRLGSIFNSIRDGMAVPMDYFDIEPPKTVDAEAAPASRVDQAVDILTKAKKKNGQTLDTPFNGEPLVEKEYCTACQRYKGEPHGKDCPIDETDEVPE